MISGLGNFIDAGAQLVFWLSAVLLAYTFVGYPFLAWIRSKLNSHPLNQALLNKSLLNKSPLNNTPFEPTLSILVIAHNEARQMRERIENLLALDYPRELLEIVIASDASTDGTAEVAMDYTLSGIRVIQFQQHRGKPAVLNEVIPQLRGDIVVMMDARQRIEAQALRALVANFTDPRTGAVSGELLLDEDAGNPQTGAGVGFYWRYEKFIRLHESRADSTVGVTGALYALRRKLFRPIPEDTLLDDVLIPMQIVRQGYRVLFEPEARAHDCVAPTAEAELTRKVRTIAGNFQLLFHETWLLNPRLNRLWFQTLSHKFFRLLGPVLLVALLLSNLLLLDLAAYRVLLLLQLLFYTAAMAGHLSRKAPGRPALMNIAYSFCLLNWATVLGFYRFVLGHQQVTWQKAQA